MKEAILEYKPRDQFQPPPEAEMGDHSCALLGGEEDGSEWPPGTRGVTKRKA
jgi:hypothetical protein